MADKLSIKEKKFCAEYVIDENGTRAAIAAGYAEKSAAVAASRLLKKANIQAEIAKLRDKSLAKLEITRDWVLNELKLVASSRGSMFWNPDGSPKDITDLDDVADACIAGYEAVELFDGSQGDQKHVTGLVKKVKLNDKLRALEMLGKHLKLFTDKVELTGEDGGPIQTQSVPVDLSSLTDEELEQLAKIVAKSGVNKGRKN